MGLPKASRSHAISSPTIETSSSTISAASRTIDCSLRTKRGLWMSSRRISRLPEPRLLEQPDGGIEGRQLGLDFVDLLLDPLDFRRGCFRDPVDQAVDGGGRRALAGHDQRRLAGERGVEHASRAADDAVRAPGHGVEAELVDGVPGESGLAATGIAKHTKDLLFSGSVLEPVLDLADRRRLQVGRGEARAHAWPSQQRWG